MNTSNPTDAELRKWAFTPDALAPEQDWNIIITTHERGPLFLELAENLDCPHGDFFLDCLYLLVGDTVRSDGRTHNMNAVKKLIEQASESTVPEIGRWSERSLQLYQHGPNFDYQAWYSRGEVCPPS